MPQSRPSLDQLSPTRIVVRGVNWLGDAVMSTPALQRLRERFPGAQISLVCEEKLAPLWVGHPALNDVISFPEDAGAGAVAQRIREGNFDLALILPNSPRSALEMWLARVPRRVGYARPWRNMWLTDAIAARLEEAPMHKLSDREVARRNRGTDGHRAAHFPPKAHHLFQYLHLVGAFGGVTEAVAPQLVVGPDEISRVRAKFQLSTERRWLGLNAGAEYGPAKRWPPESFAAAAGEVRRQTGCAWILFGGPGDGETTRSIERQLDSGNSDVINLAGRTSLRELCASLKCCEVLLTNDTGPMHVAAALGVPVVVPFGSTSPELTGPGLPRDSGHHLVSADAACAPCFRRECPIDFRCMTGIAVETVVRAVREAMVQPG